MKRLTWLLAFVLGVPLIGVGIPLVWLWVASHAQHEVVGVGVLPVLVLLLGILFSYLAVSIVAHWLNPRRVTRAPQRRNRWLEPMAKDRSRRADATGIETYFVLVTLFVAVGADIFLVLFGHPGVPPGPG